MYEGSNQQEQHFAHRVMNELKALPDAWRVVSEVLEFSREDNTKYFALTLLEKCILERWKVLSDDERNGIKRCTTQLAVQCGAAADTPKHLIAKINETLVQVVKHEWPHAWPSFIPDLCAAARTDQQLCENVMKILCILSEEVFEFGENTLTSRKMRELMVTMTAQFQQIFELCTFILQNYISSPASVKTSLVSTTLTCLSHFLKWMPYGFIFQTELIDILMKHFWNPQAFRIECICCLIEIVSLDLVAPSAFTPVSASNEQTSTNIPSTTAQDESRQLQMRQLRALWVETALKLKSVSVKTLDYDTIVPSAARLFWESFYQQLAVYLTTFLRYHRKTICEPAFVESREDTILVTTYSFLLNITRIQHDATFKICLDYWHFFTEDLFAEMQVNRCKSSAQIPVDALMASNAGTASQIFMMLAASSAAGTQTNVARLGSGGAEFGATSDNSSPMLSMEPSDNPYSYCTRLALYEFALDELRRILIARMAKPAEVYITYDEETQTIDRDYQPDTDEIALYNTMRETQVYLCNLGGARTEGIMDEVLSQELAVSSAPGSIPRSGDSVGWNPMKLNRLCWSIGAVSGAMTVTREKSFLIRVIRELIGLCETVRGKGNKAIVASQLMYIVGQYPRFLNIHWRFLSILTNKLFQFMADDIPGVQDMACEVFLKISQKCKNKLAAGTTDTGESFIAALIQKVHCTTTKLETAKQRLMLLEAVAHVVSATDASVQPSFIRDVLADHSRVWTAILIQAQSVDAVMGADACKDLASVLRTNERVAWANGIAYTAHLKSIYEDMLKLYSLISTKISQAVAINGAQIMAHTHTKLMRTVKRETLRLVNTFVNKVVTTGNTDNAEMGNEIGRFLLPPLLLPVLQDYRQSAVEARDMEVLMLLTTLIKRLHSSRMTQEINIIFDCVFDCTVDMIKTDFHSHPDIRMQFYEFLEATTAWSFQSLMQMSPGRMEQLISCFIWAFKHEQPNIADKGLSITVKFLSSLSANYLVTAGNPGADVQVACAFYTSFYHTLLKELISVMTDTLHRSGFRLQTELLRELIKVVDSGLMLTPDLSRNAVRERLGMVLLTTFQNLNPKQVETFLLDIFNSVNDHETFQTHCSDLLVQLKEFAGGDDLFEADRLKALQLAEDRESARRLMVPGLAPQP
eukprot:Lankesteria_metandrocarpae@DN3708_c0_g1_i2.p1